MQNRTKTTLIEKILKNRTVRREITTRDFEWFFPVYFHKRFEYETPPFHEEIFRLLQDVRIPLFVLTAFRGSAKSTIVTIAYTLWAIFGVQEKKFVVLVGQTEAKARQYLMNIRRQLESNKLLRDDMGPIDEERDQWGATALVIRKLDAKIMAVSVGQSIRGSLHNEHRPDLVILDDVEDTESVKTREGRDKLFNWFTAEVLPVGNIRTRFVVVGNLLHEDSLIRRLKKRIDENPTIGEYREYPIVDEDGTSLWPSKYPTPELIEAEREKMMDPIAWAREYLLKFIAADEQIIKPEWIKYYDSLPLWNYNTYYATGIDLAISQKETADYTAMVSAQVQNRYGKDMTAYIIPNVINKRLSSLETIETAKTIADSFGHRDVKLVVESNGYQETIVEHLKSARYQAEGIKSRGDKHARLKAVSFLVQSGQVLFPRTGAEKLIEQILGLGTESHDDMVDAFSILLTKIAEEWNQPKAFGGNKADQI